MSRYKRYERYTQACTGCWEFNKGMGQHRYRTDEKLGIKIGHGCSECGYTGKRRHVVDLKIVADDLNMTLKELNELAQEE